MCVYRWSVTLGRLLTAVLMLSVLPTAPARLEEVKCDSGARVDSAERCKFFFYYNNGDAPADQRIVDRLKAQSGDQVRSFALVIGVSVYPYLPGASIDAARIDAQNLKTFLKDKQNFDEIIVLENNDATQASIEYFLKIYLAEQADLYNGKSRVLFAYSGHGIPATDVQDASLVLAQATSTSDVPNLYNLQELKTHFQTLSKHHFHVLALINACYGGSIFSIAAQGGSQNVTDQKGAHAITAGSADDLVWSLGGTAGSIFFDSLIKGVSTGAADQSQLNPVVVDAKGNVVISGGIVRLSPLVTYLTDQIDAINRRIKKNFSAPWVGSIEPEGVVARGSFFFLSPITRAPNIDLALVVPSGSVSSIAGRPDLKVFNAPTDYQIRGIDVSHFTKKVDWKAVHADSIQFAYVKASQAARLVDPTFATNWKEAQFAQLSRGAYHTFGFCASADDQFKLIASVVPVEESALPLALDIELPYPDIAFMKADLDCMQKTGLEGVRKTALDLLQKLQDKYKKLPIIYGSRRTFTEFIDNRFSGFPIWLAVYTPSSAAGNLKMPTVHLPGNTPWTLWQYTEGATVKGIDQKVDMNVFFGTREQFSQFAAGMKNVALNAVDRPAQ